MTTICLRQHTPVQWLELEHAVVYVDPEHPKHAQWVKCLVSMQAMEELRHLFSASRNCVQILAPCIIMLKNVWIAVEEWHDNGP